MADSKKDEDPAPKGQLMPPGPPLPPAARTGHQRTIDWLLTRISRWPFRNRGYVESLKTAQEVIAERTKLEETVIGHAKTRAKLNDLGIIIAQDKLQRQRELLEEQKRYSAVLNETMLDGELMDDRNKVKRTELERDQMRIEKEKAELQKQLDELRKPPPAPESPKKTTPKQRQKLREKAQKRYETEIARIEAMNATAKLKTNLIKAAAQELEKEMGEIETMP